MSFDFHVVLPELSAAESARLNELASHLREWNARVNLVSRKDEAQLEAHHILPCAALAAQVRFGKGVRVLDIGCGGGLPGLVLAVLNPEARFMLIDSVGKKVRAVEAVAQEMKLANVSARQVRVESLGERFDYVTGRAVTALPRFLGWAKNCLARRGQPPGEAALPRGVFYWKGGALEPELEEYGVEPAAVYDLEETLGDEYFHQKYIAYFDGRDLRGLEFSEK